MGPERFSLIALKSYGRLMVLDGYIRVSQVGDRRGDSFISPVVQQDQIEGWVAGSGATVGEVFTELDESGARKDRPLLAEAIGRVEAGESGGVVVAKLDRFGRSVIDGLSAIARIQKAGGTFVSVQDGFDITTPTDKLVLQILFSIGEWELERVRMNWDTARQRAIERGVFISNIDPLGYVRGEDGRLRVDSKTARFVRDAFERRARGETLDEIAGVFNEAGLRAPISKKPHDRRTIGHLLRKRVYLGESKSGAYVNPKAHEPIVDQALWQLCRRPKARPRQGAEALLRGRLRCAACGALMTPHRSFPKNTAPHTYYRCHAEARRCPAPAVVRASEIEPLIEEFIFRKPTRRFEVQRVPIR
jgi:DNA invertase Pin-like site-specific DNA recombinase